MGELQEKYQCLQQTQTPRIILIGGSGSVFGIDSAMIAQEMPEYQVVNMGMYAGLGTSVMLELARGEICEGDILLYLPEQQEQAFSSYFSGKYFWQGIDGNFGILLHLSTKRWGQLLGTYPAFTLSKLQILGKDKSLAFEGVYQKSSFNAYGDVRGELLIGNQMAEGYDPSMPVDFPLPDTEYIDWLNEYAAFCVEKGAIFCFYHCPVDILAVTAEMEEMETYESTLKEKFCFPVLGKIQNSVMDASYFYDTNFHLNQEGKTLYTWQLVHDLKAYLGDNRAQTPLAVCVEEARTETAEESEGTEEAGDSEETETTEACSFFIFARSGEKLILTGLSEEGKAQSDLKLPAEVNGQALVRIAEGAFRGAQAESICIQAGSLSIEDGAFSGCPGLMAIILRETSPSHVHPGQDLLKDCDAIIYVPKGLGDRYRLSYNWSAYSNRIQEGKDK